MAAQYRNTTPIYLPDGWGTAVIAPRSKLHNYQCRSYDSRGTGLGWIPPNEAKRHACDTEFFSAEHSWMAESQQIPIEVFFRCWTIGEVIAKLADIPMLVLVKGGLLSRLAQDYEDIDSKEIRVHQFRAEVLYRRLPHQFRHVAFGRLVS